MIANADKQHVHKGCVPEKGTGAYDWDGCKSVEYELQDDTVSYNTVIYLEQ